RCAELDPLAPMSAAGDGWVHYFMRDYANAIAASARAMDLDRSFGPGHLWSSWSYLEMGRLEEAFRELNAARTALGDSALVRLTFAHTRARAGAGARAPALPEQTRARGGQRQVPAYMVATVHEALGEREPAWEWLERAVGDRDHWLVFLDHEP